MLPPSQKLDKSLTLMGLNWEIKGYDLHSAAVCKMASWWEHAVKQRKLSLLLKVGLCCNHSKAIAKKEEGSGKRRSLLYLGCWQAKRGGQIVMHKTDLPASGETGSDNCTKLWPH